METLKQPTILVVESDALTAMLIIAVLHQQHYKVHHIAEGRDFHAAICEQHYDLIICNMMISFFGGVELLYVLRYQYHKNTPFILLSATDNQKVLQNSFQNGMSDYLLKPFSANELQSKVSLALSQRKYCVAAIL